ncbi:2,5-didehydrogluconate reductase [Leptolyngbya sp. 'hensonii']|uniref:aldo/keto reductase n=1 Tax=Leptolyngbya sp. 'hensonii' TaxID=1922337 RepID=UPI00094F8595|nr:aldo/keto reductase [Leptolyngbya sp. 'hensonii']OLP19259.1 2,5-didehydrogluconate reductase [Leptolyngbya sp. 'hensonii']
MQTTTLGANGPTVPALCLGTWAWGDKLFWSYGKDYGAAEVRQAFDAAVHAGLTFFDTAEVYGPGTSEQLLGQFVKETGATVQIATKYGPLPWRLSGQAVKIALSKSLERLQAKQILLYQIHWPFAFLTSQKTLMNALADEVKLGRTIAVGVSNYSAAQMREAHQILADRGVRLASNQVRYSLLSRQVESQGTIAAARDLGVTILAYSPLAQGLLTGKYTAYSKPPAGARQFDTRFGREGMDKIAPVTRLLRQIADLYGKTPAQVALNWLIAQGNVIPIVGIKTAEQVRQNLGCLKWKMTAEELENLERASRPWLN